MKKRFFKLFACGIAICSLFGGVIASAGTLSRYGNQVSGNYAYSYTKANGSWASTAMYRSTWGSNGYSWTSRFGYAYGGNGYAQTPTQYAGFISTPIYSTHSCDSYTASKSF